jgi:hypothetical protein
MILFAYIAILITTFDKTVIGSATFLGKGPYKTLACNLTCVDSNNNLVLDPSNPRVLAPCDQPGQKIVDPMKDSAVCILGFNEFGKIPVLEAFGISIPTLKNAESVFSRSGVLTLTKAFLIMYLLYKFMDEIPGITSNLIGGTKLPGAAPSAVEYFKKMAGVVRGIQKRAQRVTERSAKDSAGKIRDSIGSGGNKGKSVDGPSRGGGEKGADDARRSDSGGGADDARRSDSGGGADNAQSSGGGAADASNKSD